MHHGKYQVRIKKNGQRVSLGSYTTIEEAIKVRDDFFQQTQISESKIEKTQSYSDRPVIVGITASDSYIVDDIWEMAEMSFDLNEEKERKRKAQRIDFGNKPIALALLSDLHIGNATTDYRQLKNDAELIKNTNGMYAIFHGDGIDNWIVPKLLQLQRGQAVNFEQELLLFESWLSMISDKLVAVVAGNHDNWTHSLSGIDIVKRMLKNTKVLYDRDEVRTVMTVNGNNWEFCIRHKWLGSSIYNPTHGIERYSRMGASFDIGIGGHTHIASISREFISYDNRQCMAIITGTYKKYDGFARQLGLPHCPHNGSGAIILKPNGTHLWIRDLQEAAEYITYLRKKYNG
jgi:UDP-2,3-diacylglucosamine pyrophosphatase LpxH